MAQKVNPNLYRMGVQQLWKSLNFYKRAALRSPLIEESLITKITSNYFRSLGYVTSEIIVQKSSHSYLISFSTHPQTARSRNSIQNIIPLKAAGGGYSKVSMYSRLLKGSCLKAPYFNPGYKGPITSLLGQLREERQPLILGKGAITTKAHSPSYFNLHKTYLSQLLSKTIGVPVELIVKTENGRHSNVTMLGEGLVNSLSKDEYRLNSYLNNIGREFSRLEEPVQEETISTKKGSLSSLSELVKKSMASLQISSGVNYSKVKGLKNSLRKFKFPFAGYLGLQAVRVTKSKGEEFFINNSQGLNCPGLFFLGEVTSSSWVKFLLSTKGLGDLPGRFNEPAKKLASPTYGTETLQKFPKLSKLNSIALRE